LVARAAEAIHGKVAGDTRKTIVVSPSEIWVVIPAYNEEQAIDLVLSELTQHPYNVVVVNDGSSDQTANVALRYPVTVLNHITNMGQGAALQTGIRYALRFPTTRYIVTFDADGQHDPLDIQRLVDACEQKGVQVALGSRFISGGQAVDISIPKRMVLKLAIWITRISCGLPLTDTHNGLRAIRADAAALIKIQHNGMAHASEIISLIGSLKISYCEVPVKIIYTPYSIRKGQSISNGLNILWDILAGKLR
jgi:polyprenyl-phospho-N-acetylgalactosaminyl synthase